MSTQVQRMLGNVVLVGQLPFTNTEVASWVETELGQWAAGLQVRSEKPASC